MQKDMNTMMPARGAIVPARCTPNPRLNTQITVTKIASKSACLAVTLFSVFVAVVVFVIFVPSKDVCVFVFCFMVTSYRGQINISSI